ncbi:growth hormone-releasing hormone receptor isoform X4 [Anas platyrhynchos]|uniref:growth hormone-releasing hormone receptor isoform X4 n=1 Tax=Anas platyrhynchos TaxID=8839 RepID=UPI003AF2E227
MDSGMLYHCVLYTLTLAVLVAGNVHPECDFITELKKKEAECLEESEKHGNATTGCKRTWDKLLCWPEADAGETLALPCPNILFHFMKETAGIVRRNCTKKGWSDPFPSYHIACPVEDEIPPEETECKISVVFCHYFVMTNFMWLLVEALYLNCLLLSSLSHGKRYFWWLVLFGWGFPTLFTLIWILAKFYFEDTECWDINQGSPYWWLIKGPIIISVGVNFVLFINIIRILLKKLDPRQINFNNSSQYRRLSRSTLLLIPLFGTHYIVFNFLPEYTSPEVRLYLELCIGSFQGFIVAVLYCFLNQEVQTEIGRRWHGKRYGLMPVWRRTRWTVPTSSGVKMTTSVC